MAGHQKTKTVMPDAAIDAEIDEFLKIFGTSLRHYTLHDTKEKAREVWSRRTAALVVKPLPWRETQQGWGTLGGHVADCIHRWSISLQGNGRFHAYRGSTYLGATASLQKAKALCQQGHEDMIRTALLPFRGA